MHHCNAVSLVSMNISKMQSITTIPCKATLDGKSVHGMHPTILITQRRQNRKGFFVRDAPGVLVNKTGYMSQCRVHSMHHCNAVSLVSMNISKMQSITTIPCKVMLGGKSVHGMHPTVLNIPNNGLPITSYIP